MAKLPNPRHVKLHRSYYVEDVAACLSVHKNTVRRWIKRGLPTVGGNGRILILGREVRSFLEARRASGKRPCPPGHFYCFKCRLPRPPAERMAVYVGKSTTSGNLSALCPHCETIMHRRIKLSDLDRFGVNLEITHTHPVMHLNECAQPSLNSDSEQDPDDHAETPPRQRADQASLSRIS